MALQTHYLCLDLKDDPDLIKEYKTYHQAGAVWPDITQSIKDSGIREMEIFCAGNRLIMRMVVDESFNFEKKAAADLANPKVQEWEDLMWQFQQALPWAAEGEKWILMDQIFSLEDQ